MAALTKDQVRQIIANRPAGVAPEDVVAELRKSHTLEGDSGVSVATPIMTAQNNPFASYMNKVKSNALGALPTVGGTIGGLAGGGEGPLAVAGATAGGGLFEGARQVLSGQPLSAEDIAKRGGEQGAYQVAGGLLAKGATRLATPLIRKGLNVSPALAERFGTTPEKIAKFVLAMRLPPGIAGKQAAKAEADIIRADRSAIFRAASGTVGAATLARTVISDTEKALGRPLRRVERDALIAKVQAEADAILAGRSHGVVPKTARGTPPQPASTVLDPYGNPAIPAQPAVPGRPSRYTAREMEQVKEVAAKNAKSAYRQDRELASVAADPELDKQLAHGARRRLARIPGVAEKNDQLRQMMAAQKAIDKTLTRSGEWTPLHIGPVSVGFKVPPDKLHNAALWLTNPDNQKMMRQSPRLAAELLASLMYTDQPDQIGGGTP